MLLVAFAAWERRTANPMLPLHMFRSRAFAAANAVSLVPAIWVGSVVVAVAAVAALAIPSRVSAGVRGSHRGRQIAVGLSKAGLAG